MEPTRIAASTALSARGASGAGSGGEASAHPLPLSCPRLPLHLPLPPLRRRRPSPVSILFVLLFSLPLLFSLSLFLAPVVGARASDEGGKALYCALCEVVVDEVSAAIARTAAEHGHTVQTKWRIDEKRHIPYARTEAVVMAIIEDEVAPSLSLYGSTNHSGRVRLCRRFDAPRLPTAPLLSSADEESGAELDDAYAPTAFNHSALLTSTLTALYERMVDSHLEDMMLLFHRDEDDIKAKLCIKTVRACRKGTSFEPFTPPQRARKAATTATDTDTTTSADRGSPEPIAPPSLPSASPSPPSPSTAAGLDDAAVHSAGHSDL